MASLNKLFSAIRSNKAACCACSLSLDSLDKANSKLKGTCYIGCMYVCSKSLDASEVHQNKTLLKQVSLGKSKLAS